MRPTKSRASEAFRFIKPPNFRLITGMLLCLCLPAPALECPIGWAAVNALGQNGTTGGGDGPVVHVTTKADLAYYAGLASPYTIIVDNSLAGVGNISVASHKTIIGAGSGVTLDAFGLEINTKSNIIIRNLTIKNVYPADAIAMRTTHHAWVDHCDLSACGDGLVDITIGSDYVTVSWTRFHHHDKVSLVNSGTQHFEDVGKCRVTYHHNWFHDNVQRNPRIGYGKTHVFNNYYTNISSYCVGYHTGASVLVENNYFLDSNDPFSQQYTSDSWHAAYADAKSVGNLFVSCTGNTTGTGKSFDPEVYYNYAFARDAAADVPTLVKASAGTVAGATNVICPTPGHGAIDVFVESGDLKWTDLEGVTSWDVYFGTTSSPSFQTNTTSRAFNPGTLAANTDYYWKVVANKSGGTVTSDVFRFRTAPTKASKPFPEDNELHAPLRIPDTFTTCKPLELTWTPGIGVASNKVYFGSTPTLTAADYRGGVVSPLYAPGPLQYGETYYWRIDTVKSNGVVVTGDTWDFKSDVTWSTAGRTEAENMVRSSGTYYRENDTGWFPASQGWTVRLEAGPGTVSSVWAGSNSICSVRVIYFDEDDGTGWFGFYVNEVKQDEWFASANNNQLRTRTINNVHLNTGDELRIAAYSDAGELNRTDCMDIFVSNSVPVLVAVSDQVINVGTSLALTNMATDAEAPPQTLTYSLTGMPTNATFNTSNGVFNWRPLVTQANSTNLMTVVVTDNYSIPLSATQTLSVMVNPLTLPSIGIPQVADGQIGLAVEGQVGPDYAVQGSTNLVNWETLVVTNPATMPFSWGTNVGTVPVQFYRIQVGPPLP